MQYSKTIKNNEINTRMLLYVSSVRYEFLYKVNITTYPCSFDLHENTKKFFKIVVFYLTNKQMKECKKNLFLPMRCKYYCLE